MCFSPKISITVAILESGVSAWIFFKYKRTLLLKSIALFILMLGFYQFTEFMICETGNASLWGTFGFITYTFLPPLGLSLVIRYAGKKFKTYWLYIPAIIFSAIAVFTTDFIVEGYCQTVFVRIQNLFFQPFQNPWPLAIYYLYYFGYIATVCFLALHFRKKEQHPDRKKVYLLIFLGLVLSLLPALILIIILPSFAILFPSIYCQFALVFTILTLMAIHIDHRIKAR